MRPTVKYGLYYFLVTAMITMGQYLIARGTLFNTAISVVLSTGLAILFIVFTIKADREDDGSYTIADGIKAGMICYGIGTLLITLFSYVMYNHIDPKLIDEGIQYAREVSEKMGNTIGNMAGMTDEQKAEMMEEINNQEIPNPFTFSKLLLGWVLNLFLGFILTLVIAAVMKRN